MLEATTIHSSGIIWRKNYVLPHFETYFYNICYSNDDFEEMFFFFELKVLPHIWNRRENDSKWRQENNIQWKLYRRTTKTLYTCAFFMNEQVKKQIHCSLYKYEKYLEVSVETIFIFFMKFSVNFYEMVLISKKSYSKQTSSSLFTIKCFFNYYMYGILPVLSSNSSKYIFVTFAWIFPSPQSLSLFHFNIFFREPNNLGCFKTENLLFNILEITNFNDLNCIWIESFELW